MYTGGDRAALANGHPPNSHTHGRINVHQPVPASSAVAQRKADQANTFLLKGRSTSDPNLNALAGRSSASAGKSQPSSVGYNEDVASSKADSAQLKVVEVETSPSVSDELMLFKPVSSVGGVRHYATSFSIGGRTDDGTRVVSPEPADSSSSSDRSFSPPPLSDSLDQLTTQRYVIGNMAKQLKASRQQHEQPARRRVNQSSQKQPDSEDKLQNGQLSSLKVTGVPLAGRSVPTPPPSLPPTPPATSQPIYVCKDSSSSNDDDSLSEESPHLPSKQAPSQSKKQFHRTVEATDYSTHNPIEYGSETKPDSHEQHLSTSGANIAESKPKVVGILKKTSSSSHASMQAESSTGTVDRQLSGSQTSISSSMDKPRKRVRFFDQVNSNNRHSHVPHSDNVWHKVLPNGFNTQHLPNSAFTPKMRLFLSSKASTIPPAVSGPPKKPTTPSIRNGITVHIPVASVETPSSHDHQLTQQSPHSGSVEEIKPQDVERKKVQNNQNSDNPPKQVGVSEEFCDGNTSTTSSSMANDANARVSSVSGRPLDNTPTDNEINEMWEQIRTCLDDSKQSKVPVQVHPSQRCTPTTTAVGREVDSDLSSTSLQKEHNERQSAGTAPHSDSPFSHGHQQASSKASEQAINSGVKLVHRQSNRSRPMRCHHQAYVHPSTQLAKTQQNNFHHGHSATYPYSDKEQAQGHRQHRVYPPTAQVSSREPELVVRAKASTINGRTSMWLLFGVFICTRTHSLIPRPLAALCCKELGVSCGQG